MKWKYNFVTVSTGKRIYWLAQFAGWTAYSALLILATYSQEPSKVDLHLVLNVLALIVFAVLGTHVMRYMFVRLHWLDLKPAPLAPRVLLASLICAVFISFATTGFSVLLDHETTNIIDFLGVVINVFALLVLVLFWNAIYFTFHFFQKSRKQELNNITLEASRNEIELKTLRSQLNPHFLFNSLNSIRALVELDPSKAKVAITTLSNLLRSSLILGKENLVHLEDELRMVSDYLELEKIRFEERLIVKWDTDPSLSNFMVPPFVLQMLAENAIKHGISNYIGGGEILIRSRKHDERVFISVINTGKLQSHTDTGIGIENTRRRLALQFKGTVDFELREQEGKVVAEVIFNS